MKLNQFTELIQDFINKKISASQFETLYINLWRNMRDSHELSAINKKTDNSLDKLFTVVDAYCDDNNLRDKYDIDEKQLLDEAKKTIKTLLSLWEDCRKF